MNKLLICKAIRYLLGIVATLSISICSYASESSDSLLNLLFQGRCFEARDLYNTLKIDSISPAAQTFYKYKDCYFNNNLEGAREYLNYFIDNHLADIPVDQKFIFLNLLVDLETEARDYCELEKSYFKILKILDSPPFCNAEYSQWSEAQKGTLNEYIHLARRNQIIVPKMRVHSLKEKPSFIDFFYDKTGSIINCASTLNEHKIDVTIDTGLGVPCLLKQHVADSLGLKKIDFYLDSLSFNGVPTAVYATLIDSIEVANKRVYNILGVVMQESYSTEHKELPVNIILGLPVLREFEGISFDWMNQKLSLTDNICSKLKALDYADMYILYNCLYSRLYLNNQPFVGMVDTGYGASPLSLYGRYFSPIEKEFVIGNRTTRQIGTINYTFSSTLLNLSKVAVKFSKGSEPYIINNADVILEAPITFGIQDGIIGLSFFKEISKSTYIDLQNMKITINPLNQQQNEKEKTNFD